METGKLLSFCGLDCSKCPAHLAMKTGELKYKKEAFEKWGRKYAGLRIEEIGCVGCVSSGKLWPGCSSCPVRACGMERRRENCGSCEEYPCEKLETLWKRVRGGKENCDSVRAGKTGKM
ncbi:MAG: DUF3795 domain-containing protein [archaeon]